MALQPVTQMMTQLEKHRREEWREEDMKKKTKKHLEIGMHQLKVSEVF